MLALLILGIIFAVGGAGCLVFGIIQSSSIEAIITELVDGTNSGVVWMIAGGVALALGVAGIIVGGVGLSKRKKSNNSNNNQFNQYNQYNQYNQSGKGYDSNATVLVNGGAGNLPTGYIKILSGSMAGMCVPISDGESIMLGKDKQTCNLILSNDYQNVSRSHCKISYNASTKTYSVTDHSSNGTFYRGGSRLPKGIATSIHSGTVIMLANSNCLVELS